MPHNQLKPLSKSERDRLTLDYLNSSMDRLPEPLPHKTAVLQDVLMVLAGAEELSDQPTIYELNRARATGAARSFHLLPDQPTPIEWELKKRTALRLMKELTRRPGSKIQFLI